MSNGYWRVEDTFVKVKGCRIYLHRAVDSRGQTIDFHLSAKRDVAAAIRFVCKALGQSHPVNPRTITVEKNPGVHLPTSRPSAAPMPALSGMSACRPPNTTTGRLAGIVPSSAKRWLHQTLANRRRRRWPLPASTVRDLLSRRSCRSRPCRQWPDAHLAPPPAECQQSARHRGPRWRLPHRSHGSPPGYGSRSAH